LGKNKTYVGIIAEVHDKKPEGYQTKDILQVLDSTPILFDTQLRLWQWIADYYMSPIGEVYKAALPAGLKAEDGYRPRTETYIDLSPKFRNEAALHVALNMLLRAVKQQAAFIDFLALSGWDKNEPQEITRDELLNQGHSLPTVAALVKRGLLLTQQDAFNQIKFSFLKKNVTLLHGVTSSGKTEIYIHLIQQALEQKKQVLYLLPEIALTVQMMSRLQRVFGNRLGIYHSKYSDAERVEIWQKQLSTHPYDVILGARSAVFLPFQDLGLVIVDEEQETSYKQQDPMPRYHARSSAIMLAHMFGAKTLLGTATPSLETYHNAMTGKYGLVELFQRYQGIELPEIQVVDIKDLQHRKMMHGPFSPLLLNKVREALERGEQAILFQNRRGYAPMVECKQCGWVPHCQHCDVSLTFHRNLNQLTCHYCGYTYQVPTECPNCGCIHLQTIGYGTESSGL